MGGGTFAVGHGLARALTASPYCRGCTDNKRDSVAEEVSFVFFLGR